MATHFSILAWKISWTEELRGHSLWGCKGPDMIEQLSTQARAGFYFSFLLSLPSCLGLFFLFI